MPLERSLDWNICVKCGKRGWHQGVCRACLDKKRAEILGPESVTDRKCKVWWCEHEPRGEKDVLCEHHKANPCEDHLVDALSIEEAAAEIGVSRTMICRWRDEGRDGFMKYRNTVGVQMQPWMYEYAELSHDEELTLEGEGRG